MQFSEIKKSLSKYCIGIAGAGGLGSNSASSLVRSGIGKLVIADFDIVSETNLNRQFFFLDQVGMKKVEALKINLERISSDTVIEIHDITLNTDNIADIFRNCDIVIEAFDRSDMKMMLVETLSEKLPNVPLIVGSGVAGWGNNENLKSRKVDDNLYLCGDESVEVSDSMPPLAPRVSIVSNMQANIVLEIVLNNKKNK
jgi:sulfur carrier protein ThiS adenylyltransferase